MPVTRHPRTDPYVRNYRIRLLPRMNRGGTACRTPNNPWDTDNARSESGPCGIRTMFSLVHALSSPTSAEYGSSLFGWFTGLRRSPTSPGRTRPSCGLGLHGPVSIFRPRHPGDLPVLVHVVSQRARGLRLRRTGEPLASSAAHRVAFLLSGESRHPGTRIFRSSKPGPLIPLSTLRPTPHDATARLGARMDSLPPFLWGSFIPCNMPVYPGAFPDKSP